MYCTILGCTIPGMPCYDSNANTLDDPHASCPDLRSFRTRSDTIVYCSDDLQIITMSFLMHLANYGHSQFNPIIHQVFLTVIMINLI